MSPDRTQVVLQGRDYRGRQHRSSVLSALSVADAMVNLTPERWSPAVRAIKSFTAEHTQALEFGLTVIPAINDVDAGSIFDVLLDPNLDASAAFSPDAVFSMVCTAGKVDVPPALNTAPQIAALLDGAAPDMGATPMAATLEVAREYLASDGACPDCASKQKYLLLITDGQPTCGVGGSGTHPDDVARVDAALDALLAAGVKSYVMGYGLQADPAIALIMDEFARHGGTEQAYAAEDEDTLRTELTRLAGRISGCAP